MTVHIHDIVWDTDDQDVSPPKEFWLTGFANGVILSDEDVEDMLDKVSEKTGYCIKSAKYSCHDSD